MAKPPPRILLADIEWKDIPQFEGMYQISNTGLLKSLDRLVPASKGFNRRKGKLMKPGSSPNGYKVCMLSKDGKPSYFSMHRLVAQAFIPNPLNFPYINHKDGNKINNHVDNLEWCTGSYNAKHAYNTGLHSIVRGSDVNGAKLDELQVKVIKSLTGNSTVSQHEIARYFQIAQSTVNAIKQGKIWRHLYDQAA